MKGLRALTPRSLKKSVWVSQINYSSNPNLAPDDIRGVVSCSQLINDFMLPILCW